MCAAALYSTRLVARARRYCLPPPRVACAEGSRGFPALWVSGLAGVTCLTVLAVDTMRLALGDRSGGEASVLRRGSRAPVSRYARGAEYKDPPLYKCE